LNIWGVGRGVSSKGRKADIKKEVSTVPRLGRSKKTYVKRRKREIPSYDDSKKLGQEDTYYERKRRGPSRGWEGENMGLSVSGKKTAEADGHTKGIGAATVSTRKKQKKGEKNREEVTDKRGDGRKKKTRQHVNHQETPG